MKCGIIDLGSNTIRLTVYECDKNDFTILFSKKTMAGLAGYVEEGKLSNKGINKAINTLEDYKNIINSLRINNLFVFATASLRNIKNTDAAVHEILKKTGLKVEIIQGEDEAVLDFIGAKYNTDISDGILVDIGGGSTEIVLYKNSQIIKPVSIPIGSLTLYKAYVNSIIPSKEEKKIIKQCAVEYVLKTNISEKLKTICGVGGTLRALLKLNNHLLNLSHSNNVIYVKDFKLALELLEKNNKSSILTILQIFPDRIHTITPGIYLLSTIAEYFESEKIIVSKYGAREGYLINKILKE